MSIRLDTPSGAGSEAYASVVKMSFTVYTGAPSTAAAVMAAAST